MTKKCKPLENCRTWKELAQYAEKNGLPYSGSNAGHFYHSNEKGKVTFSAHEKEPSKDLRHRVIKQILALISCFGFFFFVIYPNLFMLTIV